MHQDRRRCWLSASTYSITGFLVLMIPVLAMADDWTFYGPVEADTYRVARDYTDFNSCVDALKSGAAPGGTIARVIEEFDSPVMKRYLVELKAEDGIPTAKVQCTSVGTQTNEMSVVATLQTPGALDLPVSR